MGIAAAFYMRFMYGSYTLWTVHGFHVNSPLQAIALVLRLIMHGQK